jgi:hypothetical protein
MTIYYKKTVYGSRLTLYTLIKVLQPLKPVFKRRPALLTNREYLIRPIRNRIVPGIVLLSTLEDNKGRYGPALRVRRYNYRHPLCVA